MGEHAVLAGKLALCAAVEQRVYVSLQPRADKNICLFSNAFPDYQTTVEKINIEKPYQFVLGVLSAYQADLMSGCDIRIDADFSHTIGFGSSAAVTVAMVAAIRQWLNLSIDLPAIMQSARTIVRQVQGRGSGADVAASTYGGIVSYRQDDVAPKTLTSLPDLTAVYCGYKTTTPEVIKFVAERFKDKPKELVNLYEQIDFCTQAATTAWQRADWPLVGRLMSQHFKLQQSLGVSDTALDYLVNALQQQPQCYGAKISGSGLGDCVIGLGQIESQLFPDKKLADAQQFIVKLSASGVNFL
jgi:mevalonate kinase